MIRAATLLLLNATVIAAQTPCEKLRTLNLPNVTVTLAESIPAEALPAHCRVTAVLSPTAGSHIEMELWLPAPDAWNGKFEAVGNGGWAGVIATGSAKLTPLPRALSYALKEGYATAANDTGHKGANATFVPGNPEKLKDFADRAVHETTVQSKALIAAFYGRRTKTLVLEWVLDRRQTRIDGGPTVSERFRRHRCRSACQLLDAFDGRHHLVGAGQSPGPTGKPSG